MQNNERKNRPCAARVRPNYEEVMTLLRRDSQRWKNEEYGGYDDRWDFINEYGLSFDWVEGKTEYNPNAGYYRWQLSWGGPSDEFRFYMDEDRLYVIEYWFMDWFDGACYTVPKNQDFDDLEQIAYDFGVGDWLTNHRDDAKV